MMHFISMRALVIFVVVSIHVTAITTNPTQTVSGTPYRTSGSTPNAIARVEFTSVTTDNLTMSALFYGEVMGAQEVNFCQEWNGVPASNCTEDGTAVKYYGNAHQLATFGIVMNDTNTETPDISDDGTYEILSRFFLLGNALIQTIKIASRVDGSVFPYYENYTSPAWIGKAHMDFWIDNSINANYWIQDVEDRSHAFGGQGLNVLFNRPVPLTDYAERAEVPVSEYANFQVGGAFDGLAWAYFKGPVGEQLEMYQIDRQMKRGIGQAFCERGSVSPGFLDMGSVNNATSRWGWGGGGEGTPSYKNYTSQMVNGLFQYGFRTANLERSVGFYTAVLGGDLIAYPTQGIAIMESNSSHWMLFANETLEAWTYANETGISREEALNLFAVCNLTTTGSGRLDHRFILFDNFVVETLKYHNAHTYGGENFDPRLNRSTTPAVVGTVTAAFGFDNSTTNATTLDEYIELLTINAQKQGYASLVQFPQYTAGFEPSHPYSGLSYGFMKGPDSEAIQIVYIQGKFKDILHDAMLQFGAVSTMFNDTNPYSYGDYDSFCPYVTFNQNYLTTTQSITTQPGECASTESTSTSTSNYYGNTNYDDDFEEKSIGIDAATLSLSLLSVCLLCFCAFLMWNLNQRISTLQLLMVSGKTATEMPTMNPVQH